MEALIIPANIVGPSFGTMNVYRVRVLASVLYTMCVAGEAKSLPKHRPFPSPLKELVWFDGGPSSNRFMRLIRQYNSLFAFTSLGVHFYILEQLGSASSRGVHVVLKNTVPWIHYLRL